MTQEKESPELVQPPEAQQPEAKEESPPKENPIAVLQKEFDEMKDKYLRALADGENARKRLAKEKQEVIGFGIENTICDFLPAIDSFENALRFADAASSEVKNWAMGFQMILTQFRQVLQNYGITAFQSEGAAFDPNFHDAVESIETEDVPEGTILKEFTKGYRSAVRTIRPARVQVARLPRKTLDPVPEPVSTNQTEN
jgi:molecular chaperone GrpE